MSINTMIPSSHAAVYRSTVVPLAQAAAVTWVSSSEPRHFRRDMPSPDCDALPAADEGCGIDSGPDAGLLAHLASNYTQLHRRLTRHLGCPDLASESLHDAWLRLADRPSAQLVKNPDAYVYRVACNAAMERLRAERSRQCTNDAETEFEQLVDGAPGPDFIVEVRFEIDAVDRAMQRLSRRHRAVLVALRIDEMTRQEVAARYGLSLRSVDTTLRQALDLCAKAADSPVMSGVSAPPRSPRQRRTEVQAQI